MDEGSIQDKTVLYIFVVFDNIVPKINTYHSEIWYILFSVYFYFYFY